MDPDETHNSKSTNFSSKYPPKPIQPADDDCCGSGCSTCVFDLYDLELSKWQQRCEEIDNGCESNEQSAEELISVYKYYEFHLISIEHVSENIVYYKFEIPGNKKLPLKSGQHLVARCSDENGHHVIRPYTPVSKPSQRGYFEIAVKLYDEGKMSACMSKWKVSSSVEWRGPFGENDIDIKTCQHLLLIAGGTGVTPMLQFIQEILSNFETETRVYLLYSVHRAKEIIKKEWLDEWSSYWNFNVQYFITGEQDNNETKWRYGDVVSHEHISVNTLSSLMSQPKAYQNRLVFICGPKNFNKEMKNLMRTFFESAMGKIIEFY